MPAKPLREVPFVKDERKSSCQGPACALMALRFFRPRVRAGIASLRKRMGYSGRGWFTEQHIVRGLSSFGLGALYCSTSSLVDLGGNSEDLRRLFGKDESDPKLADAIDVKSYDSAAEFARSRGLFLRRRKPSIRELKGLLSRGLLVIALVNRNALTGESSGYKGHFTLLTGSDDAGFYANDAYVGKSVKIGYGRFGRAFGFESSGRDRSYDFIIIGKTPEAVIPCPRRGRFFRPNAS